MYGDDGARALCYRSFDLRRVDVRGVGIAVDEDWRGVRGRDGLGRCEEGVCGDDDFITRTYAARLKRELNGRGAVRDADAETCVDVLGKRALERLDLPAEDEGRRVQNALDGRVHLRLYRAVLC